MRAPCTPQSMMGYPPRALHARTIDFALRVQKRLEKTKIAFFCDQLTSLNISSSQCVFCMASNIDDQTGAASKMQLCPRQHV